MRRQTHDDVAEAAARRLELLRRELERAGLTPVEEPATVGDEVDGDTEGLAPAAVVTRAGRHLRPGRAGRLAAWWQERLPDTLRGRVALGGGPVLLVVGLVMVAVVVSAVAVLRMSGSGEVVPTASRPASSTSPLVATSPGSTPSLGAPASASSGGAASADRPGTVTVDVAGKVRRPGVAVLPTGSRVIDAVRHAGGARRGVDLSTINLARVLADGEQILVGSAATPGGLAGASATAGASGAAPGALVNLNSATEEQLDTLPGVGPVTAQKILAWRGSHGAFSAVDELLEVDGIGEKTLADIAPLVTL